jgi:hypothetical protein
MSDDGRTKLDGVPRARRGVPWVVLILSLITLAVLFLLV